MNTPRRANQTPNLALLGEISSLLQVKGPLADSPAWHLELGHFAVDISRWLQGDWDGGNTADQILYGSPTAELAKQHDVVLASFGGALRARRVPRVLILYVKIRFSRLGSEVLMPLA